MGTIFWQAPARAATHAPPRIDVLRCLWERAAYR